MSSCACVISVFNWIASNWLYICSLLNVLRSCVIIIGFSALRLTVGKLGAISGVLGCCGARNTCSMYADSTTIVLGSVALLLDILPLIEISALSINCFKFLRTVISQHPSAFASVLMLIATCVPFSDNCDFIK